MRHSFRFGRIYPRAVPLLFLGKGTPLSFLAFKCRYSEKVNCRIFELHLNCLMVWKNFELGSMTSPSTSGQAQEPIMLSIIVQYASSKMVSLSIPLYVSGPLGETRPLDQNPCRTAKNIQIQIDQGVFGSFHEIKYCEDNDSGPHRWHPKEHRSCKHKQCVLGRRLPTRVSRRLK